MWGEKTPMLTRNVINCFIYSFNTNFQYELSRAILTTMASTLEHLEDL